MNTALTNKIIISTRPEQLGQELGTLIHESGGTLLHLPMIETVAIELSENDQGLIQNIEQFQWISFSSAVGVTHFLNHCRQLQISDERLSKLKFTAIGAATALKITDYGFEVYYIDQVGTSKSFGKNLNVLIPAKDKVLLVKGMLGNETLNNAFSNKQVVSRINVYNTLIPLSWNAEIIERIAQNKYDMIFFSSPSGFNNFNNLFKHELEIPKLNVAAIGTTTSQAISRQGLVPKLVCSGPSVNEVMQSFINYFSN